MTYRSYHVAIGVLRQADHLVLVQQQGPTDSQPYWVLPGGLVEAGELVCEALVREVREEAGCHVQTIKQLAYITQIDHPQRDAQTVAFVFEVGTWEGSLGSDDPDDEIRAVALVPLADALVRLQAIGWRGMREPLLAYLRGEIAAGAVWLYREDGDDQHLIGCIGDATSPTS